MAKSCQNFPILTRVTATEIKTPQTDPLGFKCGTQLSGHTCVVRICYKNKKITLDIDIGQKIMQSILNDIFDVLDNHVSDKDNKIY